MNGLSALATMVSFCSDGRGDVAFWLMAIGLRNGLFAWGKTPYFVATQNAFTCMEIHIKGYLSYLEIESS